MNKIKYFSISILALAMVYIYGCGDDTTNNNGGGSGNVPTLNMQVGSVYIFNIDSLGLNGSVNHTSLKTSNTFQAQGTYFGQANAFQILSQTKDTISNITLSTDTFYVRYDGGKFYQYGVLQIISPTIPASWDLVADFNVSQGTSYTIASNVPISQIPGATANITGKIAADTTFTTHGYGNVGINCYRSEIVADIIFGGFSIGKVYVDYYIGDADPSTNPSGMVRVKLRPINVTVYQQAGVDQYFQAKTP